MITNPTKEQLVYPFDTYTKIYNHLVKNNLHNESIVRMQFVQHEGNHKFFGDNTEVECKEVHWKFDVDFIKARCFDEAKNLPYEMNEEIMRQAFHASNYLKQTGMVELGDWLIKIAENERERIMNEKFKNE